MTEAQIDAAARAYARKHGTSYQIARILVQQTIDPADRDAAIDYMLDNPGCSGEEAYAAVRAGKGKAIDPHAKPPGHDAAMAYIREHPGFGYEKALAHVLGK